MNLDLLLDIFTKALSVCIFDSSFSFVGESKGGRERREDGRGLRSEEDGGREKGFIDLDLERLPSLLSVLEVHAVATKTNES